MIHILPDLGYSFDALEPSIDAKTMEIHYTKHHQAYVDNLNKALTGQTEFIDKSLDWLLGNLDKLPESIRLTVRNHGGGHYNHSLFWRVIGPSSPEATKGQLPEVIKKALDDNFDSFESFKSQFSATAMSRFGSGWAWLCVDKSGKLEICSTPNQDNPIMDGKKPILGLDVWEHAYYLKYQNSRKDYVDAFWNIVNWEEVDKNLGH